MRTFLAVTDERLSQRLEVRLSGLSLIAPAVSESVATALEHCLERTPKSFCHRGT